MATVGEVVYDAKIDYADFVNDAKKVEGKGKDLSKNLSNDFDKTEKNSKRSFDGVGRNLLGLAAKITAVIGVSRLLGDAFKDLSSLETSRMSFEVLTGSIENASKVMKEVAIYARDTPFEFPELAEATKLFLGYGVSQDKVGKIMRQVGDIAGATGSDIGGVSLAMAQMIGRGKVTGDNFRQLLENGVNLRGELSKIAGIDLKDFEEAMKDGVFSSDMLLQAMEMATSESGRFFGGAEKLSKTLSGRLSVLKDAFTESVGKVIGVDFLTGAVKAEGLYSKLTDGVKALSEIILGNKSVFDYLPENFKKTAKEVGDYLIPKLEKLWKTVTEKLIPALSNLWKNYIEPLIPVIGTVLVGAIGLAFDIFEKVAGAVAWFAEELANGNPFIWTVIGSLGGLATALTIWSLVNKLRVAFEVFTLTTLPSAQLKLLAFKGFLSTPMVMPAIAIGAGLAAIATVWQKYNEMKSAVEGLQKSTEQYNASKKADSDYLLKRSKDTSLSKADRDRAWQGYLNVMNRAGGGPVSANMPYLVGENADGSINKTTELFVPKTSGTIVSSKDLQSALSNSRSINMTNNYVVNNLADAQALSYEIAGKVKFA